VRVPWGWLLFYHANEYLEMSSNRRYYRMGMAVLNPTEPWRVLYRHPEPIFSPEEPYEIEGPVGNVVFGTGLIERESEYWMYYGAGDGVIGLAIGPKDAVFSILERALGPSR
jgi:predicted GH43/DUF377 family glycosyl hydrolase